MLEFALVAPVMLLLVLGVLEAMLLMFSITSARFAVTEAGRIASELGNNPTTDQQAVAAVRASILGQSGLVQVSEVDVYKLDVNAGTGALTEDPTDVNRYNLDGSPIGTVNWLPATRNVTLSNGDYLGVTIVYSYRWKTGLFDSFLPAVDQTAVDHLRVEPQVY